MPTGEKPGVEPNQTVYFGDKIPVDPQSVPNPAGVLGHPDNPVSGVGAAMLHAAETGASDQSVAENSGPESLEDAELPFGNPIGPDGELQPPQFPTESGESN